MCYWQLDDSDTNNISIGRCRFRPIQGDLMRVITVALISAIVSAPLSLSVQYIISNILSKETQQDESRRRGGEGEQQHEGTQTAAALPTRRLRKATRHNAICEVKALEERCGGSLIEDMQNLIRDILRYRKGITSGKERAMFDGKGT
jgi:hypothetical protein